MSEFRVSREFWILMSYFEDLYNMIILLCSSQYINIFVKLSMITWSTVVVISIWTKIFWTRGLILRVKDVKFTKKIYCNQHKVKYNVPWKKIINIENIRNPLITIAATTCRANIFVWTNRITHDEALVVQRLEKLENDSVARVQILDKVVCLWFWERHGSIPSRPPVMCNWQDRLSTATSQGRWKVCIQTNVFCLKIDLFSHPVRGRGSLVNIYSITHDKVHPNELEKSS